MNRAGASGSDHVRPRPPYPGRSGHSPRSRWPALLAGTAAMASWWVKAAEPLPCHQQRGELGWLLCERARQAQGRCAEVDSAVQGHCQACWLANHPLPCEQLPQDESARCRRAAAALERCGRGHPERFLACAERVWAGFLLTHPRTRRTP